MFPPFQRRLGVVGCAAPVIADTLIADMLIADLGRRGTGSGAERAVFRRAILSQQKSVCGSAPLAVKMRAIINCIPGAPMSRALWTAFLIAVAVPALADEPKVSIIIRDNGFTPSEIEVPAGQKIELSVKNDQKRAAEFESHALRREKVIPPGATGTVYVGPLQPGRYEFFDEFHPNNRGFLVAK
jgi:hypothetical protein